MAIVISYALPDIDNERVGLAVDANDLAFVLSPTGVTLILTLAGQPPASVVMDYREFVAWVSLIQPVADKARVRASNMPIP